MRKQKVDTLRDDVRRVLREARVGLAGAPVVRGNSVEVRIRENDLQQGLTKLRELSAPLGGVLSTSGQRSVDIQNVGGGLVRLTVTEPAIIERTRQVVDQSIEIIERRINGLGLVEPSIQRQGNDRVLVQVPGLGDPQRLLDVIGKTAKLTFRMVDVSMTPRAGAARPSAAGIGNRQRLDKAKTASPICWRSASSSRASELTDAQPGFDQRTSEPIVSFKFNTAGARAFRARHAGECRPAVRHRARRRGDLGAGDPRADPRRQRADFRQLHGRERQQPRHPAARRRAAGAS